MTLGLLLLVDAPNPDVRIQLGPALAVAASLAFVMIFLLRLTIKAMRTNVISGTGSLEGAIGQARSQVDQDGGKVFVSGEWWEAVSEQPVPEGSQIRVLGSNNLTLSVEAHPRSNLKSDESPDPGGE